MHTCFSLFTRIFIGMAFLISFEYTQTGQLLKKLKRPLDCSVHTKESVDCLDINTKDPLSDKLFVELIEAQSHYGTIPFLLAEALDTTTKKVSYYDAHNLYKSLCQKIVTHVLQTGSIKGLEFIFKIGAWQLRDAQNNTILHQAVAYGNLDIIKHILMFNRTLIDQKNYAGNTPVDKAVGKMPVLELFLRAAGFDKLKQLKNLTQSAEQPTFFNQKKSAQEPESVLHQAINELLQLFHSQQDIQESIDTIECILNEEPELAEVKSKNSDKTAYHIIKDSDLPESEKSRVIELLKPRVKKVKSNHTRKNSHDHIDASLYLDIVKVFKHFNLAVNLFTINSLSDTEFTYVGSISETSSTSPQQHLSALLLQTVYNRSAALCINLGLAYEYGIGTAKNTILAQHYYEAAGTKHISPIALYKLYHFYFNGLGTTHDIALATENNKQAFATEENRAHLYQFALHLIAQSASNCALGEQAYTNAQQLLRNLALHGHTKAQHDLGFLPGSHDTL